MMRLLGQFVRMPDVSFVSWSRLPGGKIPREPIPDLVPDLAVEVLSEGNTPEEMERKLKEYFLAGVRLVWFVDPERRAVEEFTAPDESRVLSEKDFLVGGDVLPGFLFAVRELFGRVPQEEGTRAKEPPRAGGKVRKRRPKK
jgi:Uma2 family endonuclease